MLHAEAEAPAGGDPVRAGEKRQRSGRGTRCGIAWPVSTTGFTEAAGVARPEATDRAGARSGGGDRVPRAVGVLAASRPHGVRPAPPPSDWPTALGGTARLGLHRGAHDASSASAAELRGGGIAGCAERRGRGMRRRQRRPNRPRRDPSGARDRAGGQQPRGYVFRPGGARRASARAARIQGRRRRGSAPGGALGSSSCRRRLAEVRAPGRCRGDAPREDRRGDQRCSTTSSNGRRSARAIHSSGVRRSGSAGRAE